jgi:hypothetical protein
LGNRLPVCGLHRRWESEQGKENGGGADHHTRV